MVAATGSAPTRRANKTRRCATSRPVPRPVPDARARHHPRTCRPPRRRVPVLHRRGRRQRIIVRPGGVHRKPTQRVGTRRMRTRMDTPLLQHVGGSHHVLRPVRGRTHLGVPRLAERTNPLGLPRVLRRLRNIMGRWSLTVHDNDGRPRGCIPLAIPPILIGYGGTSYSAKRQNARTAARRLGIHRRVLGPTDAAERARVPSVIPPRHPSTTTRPRHEGGTMNEHLLAPRVTFTT